MSGVGVQSALNVQTSPVISAGGASTQPHIWTYIWFFLAICVILGFHIRVFGHPLPPAANFP